MAEEYLRDWQMLLNESFAMWNNYVHTGQTDRADEILRQIGRTIPGDEFIAKCKSIDINNPDPELIKFFGKHWKGESLEGKSIEIFCDQGMGDILNMLRYLDEIKRRWHAYIVLNCCSYYKEMNRLIEGMSCVDSFTPHHVPCDFHSNIFSIPLILSEIKVDPPYPAHFYLLLNRHIPIQKTFKLPSPKRKMRIGIAWKSNGLNFQLSKMKSMSLDDVKILVDDRWELHSLLPSQQVPIDFIKETNIVDLYDTASLISKMDVVVSVDTVALHLAGIMDKKTFGLLAETPDPRWGCTSNTSWYENCRTYRQKTNGDWSVPLSFVKKDLERFYDEMDGIGLFNGVI